MKHNTIHPAEAEKIRKALLKSQSPDENERDAAFSLIAAIIGPKTTLLQCGDSAFVNTMLSFERFFIQAFGHWETEDAKETSLQRAYDVIAKYLS